MSMNAQITYRSLYAITERRPEFRSLSLLADLGVPAGHALSPTVTSPRPCHIVMMAGPESEDTFVTDGVRPRWWL